MRQSSAAVIVSMVLAMAGCQNPPFQSAWNRPPAVDDDELDGQFVDHDETERHAPEDTEPSRNKASRRSGKSAPASAGPKIAERQAATAEQGSTAVDLNRGHLEAARGDLEQAKRSYARVLERDPQHAEAHHRLAVIADKQQDFATAERHYLAAVQGDPTNANLFSDLGYSYLLQGRFDASRQALGEALRLDPAHTRALNNHGLLLANLGDYDGALAAFRRTGSEQDAQTKITQLFPYGRPTQTSPTNSQWAHGSSSFEAPPPGRQLAAAAGPVQPAEYRHAGTASTSPSPNPVPTVQSNGRGPVIVPAGTSYAPQPHVTGLYRDSGVPEMGGNGVLPMPGSTAMTNPSFPISPNHAVPPSPMGASSPVSAAQYAGPQSAEQALPAMASPLNAMPQWPPQTSSSTAAVDHAGFPAAQTIVEPAPWPNPQGVINPGNEHGHGSYAPTSAAPTSAPRDPAQRSATYAAMNVGPATFFPIPGPRPSAPAHQALPPQQPGGRPATGQVVPAQYGSTPPTYPSAPHVLPSAYPSSPQSMPPAAGFSNAGVPSSPHQPAAAVPAGGPNQPTSVTPAGWNTEPPPTIPNAFAPYSQMAAPPQWPHRTPLAR